MTIEDDRIQAEEAERQRRDEAARREREALEARQLAEEEAKRRAEEEVRLAAERSEREEQARIELEQNELELRKHLAEQADTEAQEQDKALERERQVASLRAQSKKRFTFKVFAFSAAIAATAVAGVYVTLVQPRIERQAALAQAAEEAKKQALVDAEEARLKAEEARAAVEAAELAKARLERKAERHEKAAAVAKERGAKQSRARRKRAKVREKLRNCPPNDPLCGLTEAL